MLRYKKKDHEEKNHKNIVSKEEYSSLDDYDEKKRNDKRLLVLALVMALLFLGVGIACWQQGIRDAKVTPPEEILICGQAELSPAAIATYIKNCNPEPKLNCSVEELINYYYDEGSNEGIRPDIAICQAIKETGCFSYGGDVFPEQNNYCGLGATGRGEKGWSFSSPREGVRAHIQHLLVYASTQMPKKEIVDPRYNLVKETHPEIFGRVTTWVGLNEKWAVPGKHYGEDILNIFDKIKKNS